jgi:salicylate hydroxylase
VKPIDIAIVGAGIGGLTLALALRRQGFAPIIYERAAELGEVGAGLTLWPNATRLLYSLGLGPVLDAISEEPIRQTIRHFETGAPIQSFPRRGATRGRYGAPLYQIHRRDLHDMLAQAVEAAAPGSIRLGHELVAVEAGDAPSIRFADGTTVSADLIVGCDGIRSKVRAELFGDVAPRFTNIVAWRGLVSMADVPEPLFSDPAGIYIGPNCHFAQYSIRQGSILNYLAFAKVDAWTEEGWTIQADKAQVLDRFAAFAPEVLASIAATPPERLFKWGLFDREVQEQWSTGAVTLLGDAAHPMLPFLGQGAGMVIEDAIVLTRALVESDTIPAALARYEAARRDRTGYAMRKGRAHADYYNTHPDEAHGEDLAMELDLNEYEALTVAI